MTRRLLPLVLVFALAVVVFAAATTTWLLRDNSIADASIYTFSTQSFGTAAADRYIVAAVCGRDTGVGTTTLDTLTLGGVSATIVVQQVAQATNTNICALGLAAVPDGTTGDVVATFNTTIIRATLSLWRVVGLTSATPHDTDSSTAADPSVNLDIAANGFAIGACADGTNSTTTTTWTGLTEVFEHGAAESIAYTGASDDFASAETGRTITCNMNGSTNIVGVFASWGDAAGGGGGARPSGLLLGVY